MFRGIGTYLTKRQIKKCQRLKDQYTRIIRNLQKDVRDLDKLQDRLLDNLPADKD